MQKISFIYKGFTASMFFLFCLQTNCKHLPYFTIFLFSQIFANPWFYYYLPQQFLYFFPLPHVQISHIFIPFIIFIVLVVFIDFAGHNRISTNSIYSTNLYNYNLSSDDKRMTLSTFHLPHLFYHFPLIISNSTIFTFAH